MWEKVKTVYSMVNLFVFSLRHELKYNSLESTAILDFCATLNKLLLTLSPDLGVDEILAGFLRLTNVCVDNSITGGKLILLSNHES